MKKIMALILALAMALALISCGSKPDAPAASTPDDGSQSVGEVVDTEGGDDEEGEFVEIEQLMDIQIGDSNFYTSVPVGYVQGEMTDEDIADGQVAYYHRGDDEMDFDIYQFPKAEEDAADLLDYVKKEAAEYGVTEGVGDSYRQTDGLMIYEYQAEEEYEGKKYLTTTYVWENDVDYFEIVCWTDADSIEQQAAAHNLGEEIRLEEHYGRIWLGSTHYTITAPGYHEGENDGSEDLFAYMVSENSTMDFDIYAWDAEEDDTLASYAESEAEGKELTVTTVNGIEVYSYTDEEEEEGMTYTTKTCIVYDEGGFFAELVFWLDGDSAADEAETILNTLVVNTEEY